VQPGPRPRSRARQHRPPWHGHHACRDRSWELNFPQALPPPTSARTLAPATPRVRGQTVPTAPPAAARAQPRAASPLPRPRPAAVSTERMTAAPLARALPTRPPAQAASDAKFKDYTPKFAFFFPGQGAQSVGMAKVRGGGRALGSRASRCRCGGSTATAGGVAAGTRGAPGPDAIPHRRLPSCERGRNSWQLARALGARPGTQPRAAGHAPRRLPGPTCLWARRPPSLGAQTPPLAPPFKPRLDRV
jgi:hypothetical protein